MDKVLENLRHIFQTPFQSSVLVFAVILFIILLAPLVFRKIKIPGIIGLILAGVIIGPHGLNLIAKNPDKRIEKVKAFGVMATVNHIYSLGDYIFLDLSYRNKTLLKYDIEDFRFRLDDKKVTKASNVQSIELKPEFTLFQVPSFERHYRNIFVFKKLTFPGNKVFHIELTEKQYSGRVITLGVSYSDMLGADILPN